MTLPTLKSLGDGNAEAPALVETILHIARTPQI